MNPIRARRLPAAIIALALTACSNFDKPGYGWAADSELAQPTPLFLPANAPFISQRFRPVDGPADNYHRGFDIQVPISTPVAAVADGLVSRVSFSPFYGRQVFVDRGLQTRYFHLSEQRVDGSVRRGQLRGYSLPSGMLGVFAHLHFEVHRLDDAVPPRAVGQLDPQGFWIDGVGRVTCFDAARDFASARLTYPVPCRAAESE